MVLPSRVKIKFFKLFSKWARWAVSRGPRHGQESEEFFSKNVFGLFSQFLVHYALFWNNGPKQFVDRSNDRLQVNRTILFSYERFHWLWKGRKPPLTSYNIFLESNLKFKKKIDKKFFERKINLKLWFARWKNLCTDFFLLFGFALC